MNGNKYLIKIYHGSPDKKIVSFSLEKGRNCVDFGKGVYFTTNFEQAKTWACKNNAEGAVYECYLDLSEINHLSYTNKDQDLYYLLYLCRIDLEDVAKETVKNYREIDLVIGPVLDGKVKKFNDIAEQFNSGDISFEDFLRNIEFFQGYNQWCVKSQKLIDHINNNKIILHEVKR